MKGQEDKLVKEANEKLGFKADQRDYTVAAGFGRWKAVRGAERHLIRRRASEKPSCHPWNPLKSQVS